jgi:hypothetical protein
MMFKFETGQGN